MESILAKALGQDASQLAAAEKRDLLARLLGRLAHEVRNPLSSLDIHVQLLEEDLASLAPQMREKLASRLEIELDRTLRYGRTVAVVGLGYVGLPTALSLATGKGT